MRRDRYDAGAGDFTASGEPVPALRLRPETGVSLVDVEVYRTTQPLLAVLVRKDLEVHVCLGLPPR